MPRIFADDESHDFQWGGINFIQGVAAVAATVDTDYYAADYIIDSNKNTRTFLDDMTSDQLRSMCAYLGITIDSGETPDSKYTLTRAIEASLSAKYLAAVVVASTAGTATGDSDIAITGAGTYKYKTAATNAPAPLFMDDVSSWTTITTGTDITPAAGHDKISVAKINTAGLVIGLGSDDIVVKEA